MTRREAGKVSRRLGVLVGVVALAVVAIAAWRASFGISVFDDSHYTAEALLLAQGGRPLADDFTLQSFGFLLAAPFTRMWTAFFGITGITLALREVFVAIAATAGFFVYRSLRPAFGRVPSLIAAAAPLIAVPYNLFAISYNTMALVAFTLACALAFAALREQDPAKAAVAGSLAAFGGISYPPMSIATLVFVAAFALVARRKRLTVAVLAGASVVVAAVLVWLFAGASLADIGRTFGYSSAIWPKVRSAQGHLAAVPVTLAGLFGLVELVPMWLLSLGASVLPWRRVRAWCLALIPVAAFAPGRAVLAGLGEMSFGVWVSATLLTIALGLVVPITIEAVRERGDLRTLMLLAGPTGLAGFILIGITTNSSGARGVAVAGMGPLVAALLAGWGAILARDARPALVPASALVLAGLVASLFAASLKEPPPLRASLRIRSGALAGIATSPARAKLYADLERQAKPFVHADDIVTADAYPIVYLLAPGKVGTNPVWPTPGRGQEFTIDYFTRTGRVPSVAFVPSWILKLPAAKLASEHPLTAWIVAHYARVSTGQYYVLFSRRESDVRYSGSTGSDASEKPRRSLTR